MAKIEKALLERLSRLEAAYRFKPEDNGLIDALVACAGQDIDTHGSLVTVLGRVAAVMFANGRYEDDSYMLPEEEDTEDEQYYY